MIFRDERHEYLYKDFLHRMYSRDCYFRPVAYLLALDTVCREHAAEIFDFDDGSICPVSLSKGWQTDTSRKTCRLIFNLFNGYCYNENDEPDSDYTPDSLFCSEYAPYYWQAIKIRYPEYTET